MERRVRVLHAPCAAVVHQHGQHRGKLRGSLDLRVTITAFMLRSNTVEWLQQVYFCTFF
jgi:hypothetical protein